MASSVDESSDSSSDESNPRVARAAPAPASDVSSDESSPRAARGAPAPAPVATGTFTARRTLGSSDGDSGSESASKSSDRGRPAGHPAQPSAVGQTTVTRLAVDSDDDSDASSSLAQHSRESVTRPQGPAATATVTIGGLNGDAPSSPSSRSDSSSVASLTPRRKQSSHAVGGGPVAASPSLTSWREESGSDSEAATVKDTQRQRPAAIERLQSTGVLKKQEEIPGHMQVEQEEAPQQRRIQEEEADSNEEEEEDEAEQCNRETEKEEGQLLEEESREPEHAKEVEAERVRIVEAQLHDVREAERERRREEEAREEAKIEQEREAARLEEERMQALQAEEARKREEAERERRLSEERTRQRKEEEEQRRLEEARRRQKEAEEAQEAQRREAEAAELRAKEDMFWSMLAPDEAARLQGMLQAVAVYQQQLQQNENMIDDLHKTIAGKERAVRASRRRTQQATQEARTAREQEARAREELSRLARKREQYEEAGRGVEVLRSKHGSLQAECSRLRREVAPARAELNNFRERLTTCEASGSEKASRLSTLKAKCQQAMSEMRAEQSSELSELRAKQTAELARQEVEHQAQASKLRAHHAEEVSRLRRSLEDATRRRDRLRQERDEAYDQMLARQREGTQLQQQCSDARQEVLELSTQVKSIQGLTRAVSQPGLGFAASLDVSAASLSFHVSPNDDPRMDAELSDMRQQCKSLERVCARTHDALEKKQALCERWRRRCLDQSTSTSQFAPLEVAVVTDGRRGRAPFTLGPIDSDTGLSLPSPGAAPPTPATMEGS